MTLRVPIKTQLIKILQLEESPHRIALAFALGVFIAFSPTYGLHAASVVFCSWVFRLNFTVLLLGSLVNNPWSLAPILGATLWTGFLILGMPEFPAFSWENLSLVSLYDLILTYILPFTLGAFTLSFAGSLLAYPLALSVISRYRKQQTTKRIS